MRRNDSNQQEIMIALNIRDPSMPVSSPTLLGSEAFGVPGLRVRACLLGGLQVLSVCSFSEKRFRTVGEPG